MTPGIQAWRFVCFFNFRTKKEARAVTGRVGKMRLLFSFLKKTLTEVGALYPIGVGK